MARLGRPLVALLSMLAAAGSSPALGGWTVFATAGTVYRCRVGGSALQLYSGSVDHACWSADGAYIYFIKTNGELWRMNNDGSGAAKIADAPPSGKVFDRWTGDVANVAGPAAASTTITMPAANAAVTATYRAAPANVAPTVSFATPKSGDSFTEGVDLYVKVNASDGDGSVANVKLYLGSQLVRQENTAPYEWGAAGQGDAMLEDMSACSYTLKAVATDNEGVQNSASITVTIVAAQGATVGIWDRFEASVTNTKSYADPFRDVTLNITYGRPDGSTVDFWGFFDGGTTWKLRFMPDQLGAWSYAASFSDGQPGTSGTFECTASAVPGMIATDETNPMWFGFKGGGHVLVRSLHVGDRFFASNWSGANRTAFLNWAQAQGYNTLSVASHYLNRETSGRGLGWNTPDLWDGPSRQLKPAEYGEMEAILDDLAARRIIVWPFAGFFGQSSDFPTDHADQELYVRYTLARIGPYWNVLLNVAGPEPMLKPGNFQNAMSASDINRLGALIASCDVFGHLVTVHNKTGDDPFRDEPWEGFGTLQGPKTTSRTTLSAGLLKNHHPAKPLYAQETLWEGNKNHPDYTAADIRKNAYVIGMSATALNFADNSGNSSSGFSGSLDLADLNSGVSYDGHAILKKVWDFFETVEFYRMSPRQDLVDNGFCLAEPGRQYLVYLSSPGTVNLTVVAGTYTVSWINGQNTSDRRPAGTTSTGASLSSPADGDDWLVLLVRSGSEPTYTLTVNGGSGGGSYPSGTEVALTADPPPSGKEFDRWTGDVANLADVNASATTITMPDADVTVTATYRDSNAIVIECEDMSLDGYSIEDWAGGQLIATTSTGTASASFPGASGSYRMQVVMVKENDGRPTLEVSVGGSVVATITYPLGSSSRDPETVDLGVLRIGSGESITLVGSLDAGAAARVDKILFAAIADTDGDGLTDTEETTVHGTDPSDPDTDGDGMSDGDEVANDLSPLDADQDGNGVPDGQDDWDGDGASNQDELADGTSPGSPPPGDSDGISTDGNVLECAAPEVPGAADLLVALLFTLAGAVRRKVVPRRDWHT